MPWREAWHARNEITGLLPVVTAELRRSPSTQNPPETGASSPERPRPVARIRTRTWVRVNVVRGAST